MADYKGLNIRFRADTTEASKALNILSNEAKTAQGNLTGINNALRNTATNGEFLADALNAVKVDNLKKSMDTARDRADAFVQILPQLRSELSDLQSQIEAKKLDIADAIASDDGTEKARLNISSLQGQLNSLEEQERKAAAAVETANTSLLTSESAARAAERAYQSASVALAASRTSLGEFGTSAIEIGNNLQTIGDSITSVSDKMSLLSTAALATFGRNVVSNTEEFGNAISQLGGYLDISGAKLQSMSDDALYWGKETIFSATEAADAMNELAKGGMTQAQIQGGAMKATMDLAAAGGLDMASAAEIAVQAIKVFGLESEDAAQVAADAMAGAANKSTAEIDSLAQGFSQIGGAANMAGWDLNEVVGALALLADRGFSGAEAGTVLKTMLQRLASPTDKASKVMDNLGISVYDSQGKMVDAMEVIRQFEDALNDLTDEQSNEALLDIFGMRGVNGMTAMLNATSETFQEYIDVTKEAGYANEMAEARLGDLGWALELLRGEAETATVTFGTALSPKIIEVANNIEHALEWFNNLDSGMQTNIATWATMAVAAPPVISVLGHIASGVGSMIEAFGKGASNISQFIEAMREGYGVMDSLDIVTTGFSKKLETALVGVGIAGATIAIGDLIARYLDWKEHTDMVSEATDGLTEALQVVQESYASTAESVEASSSSMQSINSAVDETLQAQADLAGTMRDTWTEIGTNEGLLDQYVSTMETLSEKTSLTAEEQAELKAAVEGYNEITGAAIDIIDSQTGALDLQIDSIKAVSDAYKEQATVLAAQDLYQKNQEQRIQNEMELAEVSKKVTEIEREHSIAIGDTGWQISNLVGSELDAYRGLVGRKEELERANQSLEESDRQLLNMMSSEASSYATVEQAMRAAGYTGSQYASLTESQLAELLAAFDGTIASISAILQKFGISVGGVGDIMVDAAEDATDSYGSALSGGIDDAAKAAQEAQKRANDALYKEQQRAFDKEYKQLQKNLDAAYKLRQKQLSAEEEALRKSNDKKLSEMKAANDEAEKNLKAALDAQYSARSEALSKEVELQKKNNEKILKELKATQSAATKAFKKETDARLKEMEREYKAQVALLEKSDGTSEIDARIDQLNAETEAEKRAAKEQERAEKTASLEKAVREAKTRRSKADAEKALADYLAKIAQENREQERSDEIDRLKDQKALIKDETSAKKDALKEQYEARKEQYRDERDLLADQISEQNSLEYEKKKEELDAELQLRRDANSKILEELKARNDAEIQRMSDMHDQQESDYKEYLSNILAAKTEADSEELEQLKEHNSEILANLKESQQDQLQALRDSLDDQLEEMKSGGGAAIDTAKKTGDELVKNAEKTVTELKKKMETSVSDMKKKLDEAEKNVSGGTTRIQGNVFGSVEWLQPRVNTKVGLMHDYATDKLKSMTVASKTESDKSANNIYDAIKNATPRVSTAANDLERAVETPLGRVPAEASKDGRDTTYNYASGLAQGESVVRSNANSIKSDVETPMKSVANNSGTWGWDFVINFNNSMVRAADTLTKNVQTMASNIASFLHHSVPDKGPLADDDEWGADMVQNLIEGMQSKETLLAAEARRLADIVGTEFNPNASGRYSLGYELAPATSELLGSVNEALRSGTPQRGGVTVVMNGVTVREEADIERVSERLYQRVEQAGRRGL